MYTSIIAIFIKKKKQLRLGCQRHLDIVNIFSKW